VRPEVRRAISAAYGAVSATICCRRSCKLGELCARGSPASAVGEVGEVGETGLLGLAAGGEGSGPSPFAAASGTAAVEAPNFEEAIMAALGGKDAGM
jgi:hypothetical protein